MTAPPSQAPAGQRLAISHSFTLEVPSDQIETLLQKHRTECAKLRCTILSTRLDRSVEWRRNAHLSMRIAPDDFRAFVTLISAPPAEVVVHSEHAEDKTIPLLDVEKRLEGKTALRDRLTAMLRDPAAKSAADLVAIEKELSQAQSDIEAATAQRDYLRTITETVRVDITYSGRGKTIRGVDLTPIVQAIDGSGRTLVSSTGTVISFLVALVPWLPLIAIAVWLVRRAVRRWRTRPATEGTK